MVGILDTIHSIDVPTHMPKITPGIIYFTYNKFTNDILLGHEPHNPLRFHLLID